MTVRNIDFNLAGYDDRANQWRNDSITLNRICYMMGLALGRVERGADFEGDPDELVSALLLALGLARQDESLPEEAEDFYQCSCDSHGDHAGCDDSCRRYEGCNK